MQSLRAVGAPPARTDKPARGARRAEQRPNNAAFSPIVRSTRHGMPTLLRYVGMAPGTRHPAPGGHGLRAL